MPFPANVIVAVYDFLGAKPLVENLTCPFLSVDGVEVLPFESLIVTLTPLIGLPELSFKVEKMKKYKFKSQRASFSFFGFFHFVMTATAQGIFPSTTLNFTSV